MKKALKWGGIIFVILIVIGVIAGGDTSTDSSSSSSSAPEKKEAVQKQAEVVEVDALEFINEFDANQLAAEKKYENKVVRFSSWIKNISEDIVGNYYLSLKPTNEEYYFGTYAQCFFDSMDSLTTLKNGQKVTVEGEFKSQSLGNVVLEKCKVVE